MRVSAARNECASTGQCLMMAPNVFGFDDEGVVEVLNEHPEPADFPATRKAVRQCPTQALAIAED
jgi:ferredoxin